MNTLKLEIEDIADFFKSQDGAIGKMFVQRARQGLLTRDENPISHFCIYFLPYDPVEKKVFLVHHKKANKWIAPGGHIDKGEYLLKALNREIKEELGVGDFFEKLPKPFLLTITPIESTTQPCKEHLDIWFLLETNGLNFHIDPQEFYDTRWCNLIEAKKMIVDSPNLKAIEIIGNKI